MDISFIIPARNEGAALTETISHLCRTCRNRSFEIVLVDDASATPQVSHSDVPAELVYHRCASRVGVANARNLGASLSRGRLLFFLDAHVCFSDGWIDEMIGSGVMQDNLIVGCAMQLQDELETFRAIARETRPAVSDQLYYGWCLQRNDVLQLRANRVRKSDGPFAVPYVGVDFPRNGWRSEKSVSSS
jgi:glycosyltransferase involved in cell wall biosynthesis